MVRSPSRFYSKVHDKMLDQSFAAAMRLDIADGFFGRYSVAKEIFEAGPQTLAEDKSVEHNMQCLLSNMCDYGKRNWKYTPGAETQWHTYLTGGGTNTGCIQLATAFERMSKAIGDLACD